MSLKVIAGLVLTHLSGAAAAQGTKFGPQQVIDLSGNVSGVFAADLDGDGDQDVLTRSPFGNVLAWYENLGAGGTFGPIRVISTEVSSPASVFAADFDGDGDSDILTASIRDDKIAWHENTDGLGSFGPQLVINIPDPDANSVNDINGDADAPVKALGADLDGDGALDVLTASYNNNKLAWYENIAEGGGFGPEQVISTAARRPMSIFAADLDGDGDPDVLATSKRDDEISWFENTNGRGSFGSQRVIAQQTDGALAAFAADLDGDGDSDVVSVSPSIAGRGVRSKIAWYENIDARGTFGPERVIRIYNARVRSALASDVDGDGDLDILSGIHSVDIPSGIHPIEGGEIAWMENTDGLGSYGDPRVITNSVRGWPTVFAADLDGDRVPDVLSGSFDDDKIAWYENLSPSPPNKALGWALYE